MKTIDLTPSWQTAVRIYVACLQNPDASPEAHKGAMEELLSLARSADERIAAQKRGAAQEPEVLAVLDEMTNQWSDPLGRIAANVGALDRSVALDPALAHARAVLARARGGL